MTKFIPEQLRFPPVEGFTLRADIEGVALSSDFGPLLLRGINQQNGITHRLAEAFDDECHPSYTEHSLRDLLTQCIYQSPAVTRMSTTSIPCVPMRSSSWG